MTFTLITGANKGLGFETARRLTGLGHTVYLGARDSERGMAAAQSLGARFVQLDVTDDASVDDAAAFIRADGGHLDVLVNNAGVAGSLAAPADLTADMVKTVYEANVFGLVRVTHAMLPLLRASNSPVIVNLSSGMGSFGLVTDPAHPGFRYRRSPTDRRRQRSRRSRCSTPQRCRRCGSTPSTPGTPPPI